MRVFSPILWFALTVGLALPAWADETGRSGNAAIHYWCAAAVLKRPADKDEEKALDYIEEWSMLPPKVFMERSDAVSFMTDDLNADGAMYFLHVGAECSRCDFDTDRPCGDWPPTRQLGMFRRLAHRAWGATTLLEGQGQLLRAAQLHADFLQFSANLSQCSDTTYAMNASALLTAELDQVGAFLARKPGPEALRALMDRLNRIPVKPLSFSRYLANIGKYMVALTAMGNKDLRLVTDLDLDEALTAMQKDSRLADIMRPHFLTIARVLRSKNSGDRSRVVSAWMSQIQNELDELAKQCDGPLTESEPRVRAWTERLLKLSKPDEKQGLPGNPLLPEWTEMVTATYIKYACVNARLEMIRILCAAALFAGEKGGYPVSLDALAEYFPADLPIDPLTGKQFLYVLEEGLPGVTAQPSASLGRAVKNWNFRMSMAEMLKRQAERMERYRKEFQSPAAGAHE